MCEGGDKRLEGSNLVQTKQSHKLKGLQSCRDSPSSPRCSPENALCSEQYCHARAYTQMHTRNSCEMSGVPGVKGTNPSSPSIGKAPHTHASPPPP